VTAAAQACLELGNVFPGEVWFGHAPAQVSTLLGSCVAITLWHPRSKSGGMCHYMLPGRPLPRGRAALDGRYGDAALQLLLQAAASAGCDPSECEFKLFGGGRMIGCEARLREAGLQVHLRNVEQAHRMAGRHALKVVAQHLGGAGHRQIRMDLATGAVWLRHTPLAVQADRPGANVGHRRSADAALAHADRWCNPAPWKRPPTPPTFPAPRR